MEEWDRSLRAANKPRTTRYNYELAVAQLAEFLAGPALPAFLVSGGIEQQHDASDAAEDPTDVERRHVEWFLAWMIETRSASTALNKYKGLQQFFRYLVDEDEMARHPMRRIPQPSTPQKLIPVVGDDELTALLATCAGKSFLERRDSAIIRLLMDTGARLSEITLLDVDNLDLKRDLVLVRGKGDKQRAIPFGENTGQALTRYLRVRAKHKAVNSPALFLPDRGGRRLAPNGVKIMLRRRGEQAGISHMHAHRLRHTLAHEWQVHGGNESDLMAIMGWESPEMLRRYGRSAAAIRAQNSHRTLNLGNRV
ncbi:MAG TPA: tyrosine-type recombinase/integrase [Pseudonocardiaceae bacterium]|nr:tyrosine-type recombinase/integrase [Pseudonocardiaceae bacterium]